MEVTDEQGNEATGTGPKRLMTVRTFLELEGDALWPGEPLVLMHYSRAYRVATVVRVRDGREFTTVPVYALKYMRYEE